MAALRLVPWLTAVAPAEPERRRGPQGLHPGCILSSCSCGVACEGDACWLGACQDSVDEGGGAVSQADAASVMPVRVFSRTELSKFYCSMSAEVVVMGALTTAKSVPRMPSSGSSAWCIPEQPPATEPKVVCDLKLNLVDRGSSQLHSHGYTREQGTFHQAQVRASPLVRHLHGPPQ